MEKKNNSGVIILSILLCTVSLGFVFYVLFDQGFIKMNSTTGNDEEIVEKEEKQDLDINSRLVRNLYYMVSKETKENNWDLYWQYNGLGVTELSDFNISNTNEVVKMQLVAKNLDNSNKYYYSCDSTIPDEGTYGKSICWYNKEYNDYSTSLTYYEKNYVESIYKKLFGADAKLDTSVDIRMDKGGLLSYKYLPAHDKYFVYKSVGGWTSGPGGYTAKLVKAEKEGKKLYIYENVTLEKYDGLNKLPTEEFKMVYTFELEEDGMYKFVSRVKQDK